MKQTDFDKVLSALLKIKKNPLPQPKFDIQEIARVVAKNEKSKKFSIKDFEDEIKR